MDLEQVRKDVDSDPSHQEQPANQQVLWREADYPPSELSQTRSALRWKSCSPKIERITRSRLLWFWHTHKKVLMNHQTWNPSWLRDENTRQHSEFTRCNSDS